MAAPQAPRITMSKEERKEKRVRIMNRFKLFAFAAVAAVCSVVSVPQAKAQVQVDIGVAPECPYGYYDVAPYDCAPYGYYGTEWFNGGAFIGVGPWFHGSEGF